MKLGWKNKDFGWHNQQFDATRERLLKGGSYKDLSTVWVMPTKGRHLNVRVVSAIVALQRPMNQICFGPVFLANMEVADAYNSAVEAILADANLKKCKYLLTVEQDNLPPPDGLLRLYESIQKFDGVGGLYFTKGPDGQPMIYGDPNVMPKNYLPQVPQPDTIQHCNGLGMGFNLFRMEMFRKVPKPWFKTQQDKNGTMSQDLYFYNNAAAFGFKFACDTRVKVGHYDEVNDMVW